MKILCKMNFHKYKIVMQLSGGDYPRYVEKCLRCNKTVVTIYDGHVKTFVIERIKKGE